MENEVYLEFIQGKKKISFLLPQKRKASQWDALGRFSDNPCFNFAKHKLSSISIMNVFAVIKIYLPQFLQIFFLRISTTSPFVRVKSLSTALT